MPVPFNDAPLPKDKTCPRFPCPHPFGLGSEDHIFLWKKKKAAVFCTPQLVHYFVLITSGRRVAQMQSSLFVNTPWLQQHSP